MHYDDFSRWDPRLNGNGRCGLLCLDVSQGFYKSFLLVFQLFCSQEFGIFRSLVVNTALSLVGTFPASSTLILTFLDWAI
jgi:hypothetical protein